MEKRTMRDYVYLTPSVLRHQLAGQWEEPLAAAFAAVRPHPPSGGQRLVL